MNTQTSERPVSAWAALVLQSALCLYSSYAIVELLASWSRYSGLGVRMFPILIRNGAEVGFAGLALWGMWRTLRWGWMLGLAVNGIVCAEGLRTLLESGAGTFRYPSFLISIVCELAGVMLLLHKPARSYFLSLSPMRPSGGKGDQILQRTRVLVYFAVAVVANCAVTAFTVTIWLGQKGGGYRGFLVLLYYALAIGSVCSFLLSLVATILARRLGPDRLWVWSLLGGLLAPILVAVFGFAGMLVVPRATLSYFIFAGPMSLLWIWWLTPPIGIFTTWLCYEMYDWSFSRSILTGTRT